MRPQPHNKPGNHKPRWTNPAAARRQELNNAMRRGLRLQQDIQLAAAIIANNDPKLLMQITNALKGQGYAQSLNTLARFSREQLQKRLSKTQSRQLDPTSPDAMRIALENGYGQALNCQFMWYVCQLSETIKAENLEVVENLKTDNDETDSLEVNEVTDYFSEENANEKFDEAQHANAERNASKHHANAGKLTNEFEQHCDRDSEESSNLLEKAFHTAGKALTATLSSAAAIHSLANH